MRNDRGLAHARKRFLCAQQRLRASCAGDCRGRSSGRQPRSLPRRHQAAPALARVPTPGGRRRGADGRLGEPGVIPERGAWRWRRGRPRHLPRPARCDPCRLRITGRRMDEMLFPAAALLAGLSPADDVAPAPGAGQPVDRRTRAALGSAAAGVDRARVLDPGTDRDLRAQRRLAAPLQVHLGRGGNRAAVARLRVRRRDQRGAPDAAHRTVRRAAVGAAQGHPRRVPGRLSRREPRAARRPRPPASDRCACRRCPICCRCSRCGAWRWRS